MAFNSPSPKYPIVYKSTIEEMGRVGPGSYNVGKINKELTNSGSQHVFNSKISRSNQKQPNQNLSQLGPGKYNIDDAHKKFIVKSKVSGCKTSFNSKIQRFPAPSEDKKPAEQEEETNVYGFLLEEQSSKRKMGKLFSIVRDRKKITQSIPSIPTNEQSYGYRIDQKTKKLVQNQNPHVLLARKTLSSDIDPKIFATTNSLYNGPSFANENKKVKGMKWHKQNENKNKNNEPDDQDSNEEIITAKPVSPRQKSWEKKGNALVVKENRFNYDKIDKRKELIINSLKKKYFEFISDEKQTEKMLRIRMQEPNFKGSGFGEGKILGKIQCFLSKQNRFTSQKQGLQLSPIQTKKEEPDCTSVQKVKDQQFGSKSQRFNHSMKQNNPKIGPGSYQVIVKPSKIKNCCLKQEAPRFLELKNNNYPL